MSLKVDYRRLSDCVGVYSGEAFDTSKAWRVYVLNPRTRKWCAHRLRFARKIDAMQAKASLERVGMVNFSSWVANRNKLAGVMCRDLAW